MIVRSDVPTGVQLAMIVHAAGHSAQLAGARTAAPPTVAVCLAADPAELARLANELADLPHVVREPDESAARQRSWPSGMVPMPRDRVRRLFAHLPLAGGKATP